MTKKELFALLKVKEDAALKGMADEFIARGEAAGMTKEEINEAFNEWAARIGGFTQ